MRKYIIGFCWGVSLFVLMGATNQISNSFQTQQQVLTEITNLYRNVQTKQFMVFSTTPTANLLNEREIVMVSSGSVSLFTKIAGSTYSVSLERK